MSKQVCYDAMRFSRGGGFVARDMIPHGVRSPVRTVYRTIDSDITNGELVFWTTCGPATTFDPKITGPNGTWYFDDGTTLEAASGAEISKTFAAGGLHRAVYRPASGGLAAITAIEANGDLITRSRNLLRCTSLSMLSVYTNAEYVLSLRDIPRSVSSLYTSGCPNLTGALLDLPTSIVSMYCQNTLNITGRIIDIPRTCSITMSLQDNQRVTGSLADLPNCQTISVSNTLVTAANMGHITTSRLLNVSNNEYLTADVDTVIDSMWAARANYTYAAPALNIGGTNQAPTGNVIAPIEGADWHQDGATWIPRTAGAKIYDLAKNVNSEARTAAWTITYTGGSIAP